MQHRPFATLLLVVSLAPCAVADDASIRLAESSTTQWRIGVVVRAPGAVTGIVATTPVPMDWPEQKVRIVKEEISPRAKISYRTLDGGVKQMIVAIPRLAAGDEASAIVTFEVEKWDIEAPGDTSQFRLPKRTRETAKFLLPSPYIESTDPKIRALAPQILADKKQENAWQQTEAIFDWVRENVRYEFAETIRPATAALKDGVGDCEELSSLFIALCRANKIPARAVWVPGHTYPEFYLEDAQGHGHWFPCQAAGAAHDFGRMPEDRPILQKGDNFKVPEERGPQRYVKQFLKAANAQANPEVRFVMEVVKDSD